MRRKVSDDAKLPGNGLDFLRVTSKFVDFNWPRAKAVYETSRHAVTSIGSCIPDAKLPPRGSRHKDSGSCRPTPCTEAR